MWRTDSDGRRQVVRMAYEVATFQALRERLRCKEVWVEGSERWRNPDQDLPADFEQRRTEHYRALRKPLDPTAFIDQVREEMATELDTLEAALPQLGWLEVSDRRAGAIKLTPLEAVPEPKAYGGSRPRSGAGGAQSRWWICSKRPCCAPAA